VEAVARDLAEVAVPIVPRLGPIDVLQKNSVFVPIPLHRKRQAQRGFNQSLLIAEHLHRLTLIPCADILQRDKSTYAQSKLPDNLRRQNIANAFSCESRQYNVKTAILIDDVATSGSTLNAAAKTLKKSGFREVWGLTLARG
jgi:ComF family protein